MEKEKQIYEKPKLRKVRLDVRTSVLAVCHSSVAPAPSSSFGCGDPGVCWHATVVQ